MKDLRTSPAVRRRLRPGLQALGHGTLFVIAATREAPAPAPRMPTAAARRQATGHAGGLPSR